MKTSSPIAAMAILAAWLAVGTASAQSAGSIVVQAGAVQVKPQSGSSDLTAPSLAGTRLDMKKASGFAGSVTYYWSDSLSVELSSAAPLKHDVIGTGAVAGVGRLGTVKSLPITLLAQHRFGDANSGLRPYIGAGITYQRLAKTKATAALSGITGGTPANPTTFGLKSRLGPTVEVGAAYNITKDWSANLSINKTFMKTTGTLSTGQTFEMSLDPVSVRLGIGYRF